MKDYQFDVVAGLLLLIAARQRQDFLYPILLFGSGLILIAAIISITKEANKQ